MLGIIPFFRNTIINTILSLLIMDALSLKTSLLCQGVDGLDLFGRTGRIGGAGPAGLSVEVGEFLVNLPTAGAAFGNSQFKMTESAELQTPTGHKIPIRFISVPSFYTKRSSDGKLMRELALLHGLDCLATTLHQKCVLKRDGWGCKFCSIGTSLKEGSTIIRKTPEQLREVALEAVKEGATHMTITTGTPNYIDQGASLLSEAAKAVKDENLFPIHVQLTPPGKEHIERLFESGVDTIGIHIESFDRNVTENVCPGKTGYDYKRSLKWAVEVFGENQVSSFVIGGLGEDPKVTVDGFEELASMGVLPFLVPFRPLPGSPFESKQPPSPVYMRDLYLKLADSIKRYGLDPEKNRAGCVKCGACSAIDVALRSGVE
jgi:radical SAM protein (TIGR04043 family)